MPKVRLGSIRARLLVLAGVWITAAMLAAFLAIGTVLDRFVTDRYDAELRATADAVIAGIDGDGAGGLILARPPSDPRFLTPLSGWYWQIATEAGVIAKSPSLADGTVSLRGPTAGKGPRREPLRALRQPLSLPELDTPLTLVVTAPAREIGDSLWQVRRPLALSLGTLGLGLALAVAVQVGAGLGSLRHLGSDLRAVREGRLTRLPRVGLAEIDPLVDEINAALDQNAVLLARSRQHLGNLAHSLKTPLAALSGALPPEAEGHALIARMDRLIGWHLRRARSAQPQVLGQSTPIAPVIDDILMVLRRPMQDKGMSAQVDAPDHVRFPGERHDLEEIIGNLTDNAVKWGHRHLRLSARPGPVIVIEDDGPGLAEADASRAVVRGARLDEDGPTGTGLGLAIVADLVALHGGRLTLGRSDLGGLRAEINFTD